VATDADTFSMVDEPFVDAEYLNVAVRKTTKSKRKTRNRTRKLIMSKRDGGNLSPDKGDGGVDVAIGPEDDDATKKRKRANRKSRQVLLLCLRLHSGTNLT
jgi:hypothetical protein